MSHTNSFDSPEQAEEDFPHKEVTLIPRPLATQTRMVVNRFGLFQFVWPIAFAFLTDFIFLDLWALLIATNGNRFTPASLQRFPWTAVMCMVYPIVFIMIFLRHDTLEFWNWSPVTIVLALSMQLISTVWSLYAIFLLFKCYFTHRGG
ncbi:hypothetical protein [Rubinisphaera sp.]|uniref:hypothetical protein n=1 Tax=Rubinisphaera sp. TaxID=2024857 RepID=UPI0025F5D421|nr:hypothetical protein [Rubinisphaera sp.]|tara:strand:- start:109 stop:552 length:444 start_codon:yes stop_codon:yes gene_type:complete